MNDFLIKEYEESYKQLRFYDTRQENLVKFVVTITSTTGTLLIALTKFLETNNNVLPIFSTASFLIYICILLIFFSLLQNRLYFTYVARQLNAIREYLLKTEENDFTNNQMYLSTNFSAYKKFSIHTFILSGIFFISTIFMSSGIYFLLEYLSKQINIGWHITIIAILNIIGFLLWKEYLIIKSKKKADEAIHEKK